MFIREIKKSYSGSKKQQDYLQHRLIESVRTPHGPRQKVILNLGTLNIPPEKFKTLANMIEANIGKTPQQLFHDHDLELSALAQHFSEQILRKRIQNSADTDTEALPANNMQFETIDVNTTTTSHGKTIGAEHIAITQMNELSFYKILDACGLKKQQQQYAIAQICARIVHPSSERETARWLRETSGLDELLGDDFSKISDYTLHKVADLLLKNKDMLEQKLAQATRDLFALEETLVLYDLTNTYFESTKPHSQIAKFARSKEKRNDCPVVTLALVVDGQGFPKHSKIYEGNISEPKTLESILKDLRLDQKAEQVRTVVFDAGIATEENLKLIRQDKQFEYVAISRNRSRYRKLCSETDPIDLKLDHNKKLTVQSYKTEDELFLLCTSPDKAVRDKDIFKQKQNRFEKALQALQDGLRKTNTRKKFAFVLERIGRLKERYRVGNFYTIHVEEKEGIVTGITWIFNQAKQQEPGEYLIRTSRLELQEQELSLIHRTLTMVESAFRWLKSDLGMRPNYHQLDKRMEAHIFISVLAYFVLAPILTKLGWGGQFVGHDKLRTEKNDWDIPYGWHSVVNTLQSQTRVTTSALCNDGMRLDIRTTLEPTSEQLEIYRRLKMKSRPLHRIIYKHENQKSKRINEKCSDQKSGPK